MSQNLAEEESTKMPLWHSNFSQAFFINKIQIHEEIFLGHKTSDPTLLYIQMLKSFPVELLSYNIIFCSLTTCTLDGVAKGCNVLYPKHTQAPSNYENFKY
jgi:hypothetical protein